MEYLCIERATYAFQRPVPSEYIQAMCRHAFGDDMQVESAHELSGGLYNNTYLIRMRGMQPVILRVAPHQSQMSRHEQYFLRNEYLSQPFLAPIASLLPRTLMADFTHQLIERDYLFQTFVEGKPWSQIIDAMTSAENRQLWAQLGTIAKTIHSIEGPAFGYLSSGPQFSTWSGALLTWLQDIAGDLEDEGLNADDLRAVIEIAQAQSHLLDEITSPRLLHGDLWTVNLLIKREASGPRIVAVLDSDRTFWGDPLADWTIFLLNHRPPAEAYAFWETYGRPVESPAAQFRERIYCARYLGGIRLEQHRHRRQQGVERSYQEMQAVIAALNYDEP